MAYIPSAKALVFGRDIAAALALRLPEETVVSAFSAVSGVEGAPVISIKASGGAVDALLRIEQVSTPAKDILGLAQTVFTPHICKLILDDDGTTLAKYSKILVAAGGECILHGIKLEVYAAASAAEGGLIAGNLKATFDSIQYPLLSTL